MGKIVETDVLVVGGGGAAARAALEAQQLGVKVVLAVKGSFGAIGTRGAGATASGLSAVGAFATPGWTGFLNEGERPFADRFFLPREQAFTNIIQVGLGMADPKLARIIVEEAVENRMALLNWGVVAYPMRYQPLEPCNKDSYVSPNWTREQLEMIAKARRVIGYGGAFPPYEGLKRKFINARTFREAFELRLLRTR